MKKIFFPCLVFISVFFLYVKPSFAFDSVTSTSTCLSMYNRISNPIPATGFNTITIDLSNFVARPDIWIYPYDEYQPEYSMKLTDGENVLFTIPNSNLYHPDGANTYTIFGIPTNISPSYFSFNLGFLDETDFCDLVPDGIQIPVTYSYTSTRILRNTCKEKDYMNFTYTKYKNQGDCISYF